MKKFVIALLSSLAILLLQGASASAMTVNGPYGDLKNGWYKNSFNVQIIHGSSTVVPPCPGAPFTYNFYANTSQYYGTHTYTFFSDLGDNPILYFEGSQTYLDTSHWCPPATGGGATPQQPVAFTASIDGMSPNVSITTPSGSTTEETYLISGVAGDPENNLTQVRSKINGADGPIATIIGNTFSVSVPLERGNNEIQMVAYDVVSHSATSNSITITRSGTTGGGTGNGGGSSGGETGSGETGGGSSGSGSSGGSSGSSGSNSSSSSGSDSTAEVKPQIVKFNQQQVLSLTDPYADQEASSPSKVQAAAAQAGVTGKTLYALILAIIILFALCAFLIYRFKPVFTKLDRQNSGLRRRIILIVTLPSLVPLLGLGFLGYQQLSKSVKSSLSSQLERAAQTSALKLYREFSIRRTVISKTSNDILQIKSQYQDQRTKLTEQENSCQQIVKKEIPLKQYSKVTGDANCLPFLTGFAQLASSSTATVNDYLSALSEGAKQAGLDITAQENQRVNQLLGSIRSFFPDVLEFSVLKSGSTTAIAALPRTSNKQTSVAQSHKDIMAQATTGSLAYLDTTKKPGELILTYPIMNGQKTEGAAVIAINLDDQRFVPSIFNSTPKPYASDQVYFMTTLGELITPESKDNQLKRQIKPLANTQVGKVYDLKISGQVLSARTAPVATTNWVVAVAAPRSSVLAPLAGIQRTAIMAIAGFILLSILLGILFVSNIAGEIERLLQGAISFAKGDLGFRIGIKNKDELQVLGNTMNKMADDIKAAQNALIEKDKEFINIATHELKAPMTSILGNLSMITSDGMGQVDDTAKKLIDQAYSGTVRLRNIVTDMLDIARLESGHAEFKLEPLDLKALTSEIVDLQLIVAKQASLNLKYIPLEHMPKVVADKNKLQIIITNFVSNAIKYNRPNGTITLTHQLKDDQLITSIADSGLGIPADQQAHIFEKFYRVQNEDRANVPGTGLGMHITKRFIEAMGGKVWFTSVHGQGTTFYFSLPIQKSTISSLAANSPAPNKP